MSNHYTAIATPSFSNCFIFQLSIREVEVQRLNGKIRELQGGIRDLNVQLDMKDDKVRDT